MKITSFKPSIVTQNAEQTVALFEELGFEIRHEKDGINGDVDAYVMKDANDNCVVVSKAPVPRDISMIAMNVDDFDEAYNFLLSKGFVNAQGDKVTDTGSSKATMMVSPSGFAISISKHIKK